MVHIDLEVQEQMLQKTTSTLKNIDKGANHCGGDLWCRHSPHS